jgi:hypothetical protein
MALSNVVADTSVTDAGVTDAMDDAFGEASQKKLAEQHLLYSHRVLSEMAQVKIILDETGLTLISPNNNTWEPDDVALDLAQMPESFARSYLQIRLRNFLYETFSGFPNSVDSAQLSASEVSTPGLSASDVSASDVSALGIPKLMNDRIGGGLHVGLLEQFKLSNQGKSYFDPGWQVVRVESDGAIAVQKHGIIVHVEPGHLSAERQADKQSIQPGEQLAIRLPGYRFEPDFYIAIGDQGPVVDVEQAQEIYFAAAPAAMPLIMKTLTSTLNAEHPVPYTLKVPYEPEGYEGPEAIVLRIKKADFDQVLPLLQQIWERCFQPEAQAKLSTQALSQFALKSHDPESPLLRPDIPLFAYPLWPGISAADVIESSATDWFGSSVELSRIHLVAEALTQVWYERLAQAPNAQDFAAQNLSAMQTQFAEAQLSWEQPFSRALTI